MDGVFENVILSNWIQDELSEAITGSGEGETGHRHAGGGDMMFVCGEVG